MDFLQRARLVIQGEDKTGPAFKSAAAHVGQLQQRINGLSAGLTGITGAFGAAIGGFGLAAFVKNTVDGIDALNDLADATGSTVGNLSALEDVARRGGSSMDDVSSSVLKLNQALTAAKPGSDVERALQAIGLSAKDLRALDPAEALRRVAVAMAGYADDGNKARLMQELFGKSTKDVAKFLKDLAGEGELVAKVTDAQAQAAKRFSDQMDQLGKNATDAARAITGPLITALNRLAEGLPQQDRYLGLRFDAVMATKALGAVTDEMARLQAYMDKQSNPSPALATRMAQLRVEAEALTKTSLAAAQALKDFAGVSGAADYGNEGRNASRPSVKPPSGGGGGKAPTAERRRVIPDVDPADLAAIRAIEQTDTARIATLNAQLTALFTLQRESKGAPGIAEAIAATREQIDKLDPALKVAAEEKKRLDDILKQTPSGKFDALAAEIAFVTAQFDKGRISADQWAEAVATLNDRTGSDDAKKTLEEASEFAKEASRNIQDALGDTVLATLDGKFSSIGDLWTNMLKRMAAEAIAANLASKLLGNDFAKSGKVGGLLGDFLKAIGGGSGGGASNDNLMGFGGAFADGGYLGAGKWGIAGERGPEIIKGPAQVVPMAQARVAGGGIIINVAGDVSERNLRAIELGMAQAEAQRAYMARFA